MSKAPKYNMAVAKAAVEAVRAAMDVCDEVDLGRTRHNPELPDFIPQKPRWEVDEKELEKFHVVLHLLTCAIFGVDGDGDRAVQHSLVDRTRWERDNYSPTPNIKWEDETEENLWRHLQLCEMNLSIATERFKHSMRVYGDRRAHAAAKLARKKRSKGCEKCGATGFLRVTYKESEAWAAANRNLANRRDAPNTGEVDCPKCSPPEKVREED